MHSRGSLQHVPAVFKIDVFVLGKFDLAQLVVGALAKKVWFGDDGESATALLIDLATVIEDDLVGEVVLCTHYSQDDGARVLHVLANEVQNQFLVRFRLGLVCRMNKIRKINKSPG